MLSAIFVWTLGTIVVATLIVIALFISMCSLIKHLFNVLFKKDCSKCKHYYLHSVTGAGGSATYKCRVDSYRTIRKHIDSVYTFCKNFVKK